MYITMVPTAALRLHKFPLTSLHITVRLCYYTVRSQPHLPRLQCLTIRRHTVRLHFCTITLLSTFDASRIVSRRIGPGPPHPRFFLLQRS
jgi:hypothetical protein